MHGASRLTSKKRKRILADMPQRVETGYVQWQSDCHFCNGLKWAHREWTDDLTGEAVALFNPRTQAWSDHFEWTADNPAVVLGKTATGRATVACLQMNDPDMLAIRSLLAEL